MRIVERSFSIHMYKSVLGDNSQFLKSERHGCVTNF